jgi:hypothetical protein
MTTCTVQQVTKESDYRQTGYVSYKKYRVVVDVTYAARGGKKVLSSVYGPVDQQKGVEGGYTVDRLSVSDFMQYYTVGKKYPCYYSLLNSSTVTFNVSPLLNLLILLPIFLAITSVLVCVFPRINFMLRKRKKDSDRRRQYNDFNEVEMKYTHHEDQYEVDYMDGIGDTVGKLLNTDLFGSSIGHQTSNVTEEDLDDEFILEEEMVETIGSFFGVSIESNGDAIEAMTTLPDSNNDEVHYETDEEEDSKQKVLITNSFIVLEDEANYDDDDYSNDSDETSYDSDESYASDY